MAKSKEKAPKKASKARRTRKGLSEKQVVLIRKIGGLLLCLIAIFTLVSVCSYLLSWKVDQSLFSDPEMMKMSASVANWGGKLGLLWSHLLVAQWFGLGSIVLIVLLFASAARTFFIKRKCNLLKISILTLSAAILSSIILAYVASFLGSDVLFGGGLGGYSGAYVSKWLVNLMGLIPAGCLLAVCTILWLIGLSGAFTRWFSDLGEADPEPEEEAEEVNSDSENISSQGGSENPTDDSQSNGQDTEDQDPEGGTEGQGGTEGLDGQDGPEGPEGGPETAEGPENGPENPDGPETPVGPTQDGPDGKSSLQVVEGDDLTAEDGVELPRIDQRDELSEYQFPPLEILGDYSESIHTVTQEELNRNNNKIRATLQNYHISVDGITACLGPTVTLYKVQPSAGVRISSIRSREEDIALAIGATGVRIITLPDVVGIEVPNSKPSIVPLKSLLVKDAFRNSKYELPVAMGYTVTQEVKVFDLYEAPHLLIAGATRQGKSVGLNVIIASLLYAKHPSEMKFVFVDPKMVEFTAYSKLLKHYLAVLPNAGSEEEERQNAIVKKAKDAEEILRSLCIEMDERYNLMSQAGVNNVKAYNEKYKNRRLLPTKGHRYMPYLVTVIDEYADLIMSDGDSKKTSKSITNSIVRLAQKGRAAGLHVIIATQRPTVNVITGLIKTNFPMRIAFRTVSRVDSATILDNTGAERLIGKGDMLFYSGVAMERMQCAMVSMDEINEITDFIGNQTKYKQCYNTPYYLPAPEPETADEESMIDMQNIDALFKEAAEYIVTQQKGSTSMLQRRFGVGFARAGKIMDQLFAAGIVGPQDSSKPREVLVQTVEDLQPIFDSFLKQ